MPSERRNRWDIYADIFRVIKGGEHRKSWVVFKTNINYNVLNLYLNPLCEAGMLVTRRRGKRGIDLYIADSVKVDNYLKHYEMMTKPFKPENQEE